MQGISIWLDKLHLKLDKDILDLCIQKNTEVLAILDEIKPFYEENHPKLDLELEFTRQYVEKTKAAAEFLLKQANS